MKTTRSLVHAGHPTLQCLRFRAHKQSAKPIRTEAERRMTQSTTRSRSTADQEQGYETPPSRRASQRGDTKGFFRKREARAQIAMRRAHNLWKRTLMLLQRSRSALGANSPAARLRPDFRLRFRSPLGVEGKRFAQLQYLLAHLAQRRGIGAIQQRLSDPSSDLPHFAFFHASSG